MKRPLDVLNKYAHSMSLFDRWTRSCDEQISYDDKGIVRCLSHRTLHGCQGNMKLTFSLALVVIGFFYSLPALAQSARSDDATMHPGVASLPVRSPGSSAVAELSTGRSLLLLDAAFQGSPESLDLSFALRDPAQVTIVLLDASGEPALPFHEVASYDRGEHHLSLEVDDLPSGSYLLRLSTSQGLAQQRIILSR